MAGNNRKMMMLYPYLLGQTWVFDDARTGLKEEAFVLGMSETISRLVSEKHIPDAAKGFALHFSDESFEGFDAELTWLRSDDSQVVPGQDGSASQILGNWYRGVVAGQEMEGWLCPALGLYFGSAPARIYVKAEPLPSGVDPIWPVSVDDLLARRFVSATGSKRICNSTFSTPSLHRSSIIGDGVQSTQRLRASMPWMARPGIPNSPIMLVRSKANPVQTFSPSFSPPTTSWNTGAATISQWPVSSS